MWNALRARGLNGLRAKRQVPFGRYILDFAIPAQRLVVEVDGETHGTDRGLVSDRRRDQFMIEQGWRVLRFTNSEVLGNLEGVLTIIAAAALSPNPHPGPLPEGEGEEA